MSQNLGSWFRHIWEGLTGTRSTDRLRDSLPVLEQEIHASIAEAGRQAPSVYPYAWDKIALKLIGEATEAVRDGEGERGWRCFMAADRMRLFGMSPDELAGRAEMVLKEAEDKASPWRAEVIRRLIVGPDGKVPRAIPVHAVVVASWILHEHFNNHYQKMAIWRRRLNLLAVLSLLFLFAWWWHAPEIRLVRAGEPTGGSAGSNRVARVIAATATNRVAGTGEVVAATQGPATGTNPAHQAVPGSPSGAKEFESERPERESRDEAGLPARRKAWLGLMMMGILGALISGFTAAIGQDAAKAKIPYELSSSTITFARFFLGAVSAVAVTILAQCGLLNIPGMNYELMMAIALACGFSDRLLLRGIAALDK